MVEQGNVDPITKRKLCKGWNLHHRNLSATDYEDLSNEDDFVCLNKMTHTLLHDIYRYWKNDKDILTRIEQELEKWHN